MWLLVIVAIIGLLLDVVIHVAAIAGFNPQNWIQPDWLARLIFFGFSIGLVLVAAFVSDRREKKAKHLGVVLRDKNPFWFYAIVRIVMVYGLICAFIGGIVDVRRAGGDPQRWPGGVYVVDPGHGHPVQQITEQQYNLYRRRSVRAGTGFFLMFYLQVAFDLLWYARNPVEQMPVGPATSTHVKGVRRIMVVVRRWRRVDS